MTVLISNYMEWALCSSVEGHEWGVWEVRHLVRHITWMAKTSGKYLSLYLSGSWLESSGTPTSPVSEERVHLSNRYGLKRFQKPLGYLKGCCSLVNPFNNANKPSGWYSSMPSFEKTLRYSCSLGQAAD